LNNTRDVTRGARGGAIPQGGAQFPGRRIIAGAKTSQQCHKHLFQNSTFVSEKSSSSIMGAPNLFLSPGAI